MNQQPDQFIAIGVGKGDAFFLRRGCFTALVDGGGKNKDFPKRFREATGQSWVDVAACTHADEDHAGGLISFYKGKGRSCQLWLPASWLPFVLNDRNEVIATLADQVRQVEGRGPRCLEDLVDLYDSIVESDRQRDGRERRNANIDDMLQLHKDRRIGSKASNRRQTLSDQVKATLARIQDLYDIASKRRTIIRWFHEGTPKPCDGIRSFLQPVNAQELKAPPTSLKTKLRLLLELALTESNRRSLVFHSPSDVGGPAVLFAADSDLMFKNMIPWSAGMIITVPHHGSKNNTSAYRRFERETQRALATTWVRSDMKSSGNPCDCHSCVPGVKFCTICRHPPGNEPQDVRLAGGPTGWVPESAVRPCSCWP